MQAQDSSKKICQFEIGHQYCSLFNKLGVPRDDRWRSLLSCLRSMHKYSYYSSEQKQLVADLLITVLEGGDFSDEKYQKISRSYQMILASTYAKRLEEALQETADLVTDFKKSVFEHQGAVEDLQEQSVAAVRSGEDPEAIITMLRRTFQDVISVMKKDTDRLDNISKTDALTGLFNRRAFDESLKNGVAAWSTSQTPLCLLLLDIDNLKDFNDRFGHRIGDQALQTFSQIMQEVVHKSHDDEQICCYRFGGDEFALLLHGEVASRAAEIAVSVRLRLETYDFVVRDNDGRIINRNVQMTVSCGYSEISDLCSENIGEHLIDTADAALYEAKDTGRNKIVQYVPKNENCTLMSLGENNIA